MSYDLLKMRKRRFFLIEEGKDMTLKGCIDWMNRTFTKRTKRPYTHADLDIFMKRGHLPFKYGLWKLEKIEVDSVNLKIVRVTDLNDRK